MKHIGLVLEGGGMRACFTAGVLDYWMEKGLYFREVYGVSAGACLASSYLCRQPGRGIRVWTKYLHDPRYCSLRSLVSTGDLFGAEFNYDLIPRIYEPLDNETCLRSDAVLRAVVTNVESGLAEYIPVRNLLNGLQVIRASASLPLISNIVTLGRNSYLDGGIADSIPVRRSVSDGHEKNVVILTQAAGYRKKANRSLPILKLRYRGYPKLIDTLARRHDTYNETLEWIGREEAAGNLFVIRPDAPPETGRIERNPAKLKCLYDLGYQSARKQFAGLLDFLGRSEGSDLSGV